MAPSSKVLTLPKLEVPILAQDQLLYWLHPKRDPQPPEFVYVIQAHGDTPIKVGKATKVWSRMAQLQTGNPRLLELEGVLVGGEELERVLHRHLGNQCRMVGEWFDGPEVPPFIEMVRELGRSMIRSYQVSRRLPNYRDFTPFTSSEPGAIRRGEEGLAWPPASSVV